MDNIKIYCPMDRQCKKDPNEEYYQINKMKYKNCKYYTTKDFIMLIEMLANSIDKMGSGNDK